MNKPIPIPPSGYPSVINAVTHAMASAEIHEEDFNADTDKYMIEVATNIWNEDSGDSGRRSYCSLVETLMAKNKRIKRREEQNPELFFSDMVKRANSFTINMQEKKTCNGCKNVDRISDKVSFIKFPPGKEKNRSVKMCLSQYQKTSTSMAVSPCSTCSAFEIDKRKTIKDVGSNLGLILPRIDARGRITKTKITLTDRITLDGKEFYLGAVVASDGGSTATDGPYTCFARRPIHLP